MQIQVIPGMEDIHVINITNLTNVTKVYASHGSHRIRASHKFNETLNIMPSSKYKLSKSCTGHYAFLFSYESIIYSVCSLN